jgi:hypothetical protein
MATQHATQSAIKLGVTRRYKRLPVFRRGRRKIPKEVGM